MPQIPSLLAPPLAPSVYATPYSSQKASPSTKLQYVLQKSPPTLTTACKSCNFVGVDGFYGYAGRFISDGVNCTYQCLMNPQWWLPQFMKDPSTTLFTITSFLRLIQLEPGSTASFIDLAKVIYKIIENARENIQMVKLSQLQLISKSGEMIVGNFRYQVSMSSDGKRNFEFILTLSGHGMLRKDIDFYVPLFTI